MIRQAIALLCGLILTACQVPDPANEPPVLASEFGIAAEDIQSGYAFLTPQTQTLQDDDFANPGTLWVETGHAFFMKNEGTAACQTCHVDPQSEFKMAATQYPVFDEISGTLVNLEGRINLCRTRYQNLPVLDYESENLLALTTFVRSQSQGVRIDDAISPALMVHFNSGQAYFQTRRGQLNLSCQQCHDQNWGQTLRGDTISQGHINGFPTYRNDWQTLGSSHRRFSDCDRGVRAEPLPLGDQTYVDLEVYLNARGSGLKVETPAIRR